jgi:hypothetical protein
MFEAPRGTFVFVPSGVAYAFRPGTAQKTRYLSIVSKSRKDHEDGATAPVRPTS